MAAIQSRSVELLGLIEAYDYYQHLLQMALDHHSVTEDQIRDQVLPPKTLCGVWNTMWDMLPDHPAIHRPPFDLLCDLCEYPDE